MTRKKKESRPSSAQDGQTNYCGACEDVARGRSEPHTCHLRPMSAAEREFIEATFHGLGYGSDRWMDALDALRAEREVKRG